MNLKKLSLPTSLILISFFSVPSQTCKGNFLNAEGNKLIDSNGKEVRLTGVNWFGFETAMLIPHGIWCRDTKSMLQQIKDQGFNCLRIPWCNKILAPSSTIQIDSYGSDPYSGVTPMNEVEATKTKPIEIMDIIVEWCQANNMKVILDNHSRNPDGYMVEELWYTPEVSHDKWIEDWIFIADRYKGYDAVIAMDINNEPHGKYGGGSRWGTGNLENDWRLAAQECGNAILAVNPNVLIMVEGTEEFKNTGYWWGGNLQGAKEYPVVISNPSKLVYSPHEYGPTVHLQKWFGDPAFPANMPGIWEENFNYLHTNGTSPLFIGEFGIRDASGLDEVWFDAFLAYMHAKGYSWTFWCWNPNSGDTGGLLDDQWKNMVEWKMNKLRPYLAPEIPNCGGISNRAPIAKISVKLSSDSLPVIAIYSASRSSDPDGDAITYRWTNDSTAETFQVVYHTAGKYSMGLSVSDGQTTGYHKISVNITGDPVATTGISVSPTELALGIGHIKKVTATVSPPTATNSSVVWSSSNTSVASVNPSGAVSAIRNGNASIIATTVDGGFQDSCSVSVSTAGIPVTGISLKPATASINQGGTERLTATVSPANATDKRIVWSSSHPSVASISQSGSVFAIRNGNATITVTAVDGGFQDSCLVSVLAVDIPVTGISVSTASALIKENSTSQLTAVITPVNATKKKVSWSTDNTSVATVSQNGLVKGLSKGSANITVTSEDGRFAAKCVVTIISNEGCVFNVPQPNALSTIHCQYRNIYVIGNGPDLSNVTEFTINWDLPNNGLWQLSMNTHNGQPTMWKDLKSNASYRFNGSNPEISLSGTGFPGLDEDYWVTTDGENFVMLEKSGAYSLYFSTSPTGPCGSGAGAIAPKIEFENDLSIYPVFFDNQLNISGFTDAAWVGLFSVFGQRLLKQKTSERTVSLNVSDIPSGTYILNIKTTSNFVLNKKLVKK